MANPPTLRSPDLLLLALTGLLCAAGLVAIAGATSSMPHLESLWKTQLKWMGLGVVGIIVVAVIDYRHLLKYAFLFYGVVLGAAILSEVLAGLHRGQRALLPILGHEVQTAEPLKLATILALAALLYPRAGSIRSLRDMDIPLVLAAVPTAVVLKQGDLGTALVFFPICFAMLYTAGMHGVYLLFFFSPLAALMAFLPGPQWPFVFAVFLLFLLFVMRDRQIPWLDRIVFLAGNVGAYIMAPIVWNHLEDYRKARLLVFVNPAFDASGAGYHLSQSLIAIGSGGLLGKGWKQGTQGGLQFLPEPWTDFIFANWAEEWGFAGAAVLLGLFLLFLWRVLAIGAGSRDIRGALIAAGVSTLFAVHLLIAVGMTIRLMPITGIPLLLISYGGSSLITALAAVGFVLNAGMRRDKSIP